MKPERVSLPIGNLPTHGKKEPPKRYKIPAWFFGLFWQRPEPKGGIAYKHEATRHTYTRGRRGRLATE